MKTTHMKIITGGLLTFTAACLAVPAFAQTSALEYSLEIERQPVADALIEISRQTGLQFGYFPETPTEKIYVGPLSGRYTADAAIAQLLLPSGLSFERLNERTIAVTGPMSTKSPRRGVLGTERKTENRTAHSFMRLADMRLAEGPATEDVQRTGTAANARESESDNNKRKRSVLEEVIVTAQKREQRTLDIPMSISVLNSQEVERKGIVNMVDLSYAAPGMMAQEFGPGRQVIYMRGVGNRVGDSALTGVYLDEVPVTAGTSSPADIGQLDLRTTDLERVEVLKGPQGTLYGAGAVSGTVRFITADPKLDGFSGKGDLTALFTEDGQSSQRASAVLNLPVVKNIFGLRVAATVENNGGWIDRPDAGRSDVNENDLTNVRVKSLWQPSDAFDVETMVIVNRNSDRDGGGVNHSDPDGNYRLGVDPTRESPFDDNYELYNLTATYDFGPATLLASSSYIDHDANFLYTFTAGPETEFPSLEVLLTFDNSTKAFSQEIRLASSGQQSLKWTAGVYYQDVEEQLKEILEVFFGGFFGPFPREANSSSTSWAAFGDVTYALTKRLEIGLGGRYFEDDKTVDSSLTQELSDTFQKVTWRATASYALRDHVKSYLNISTGFRSGGFSNFNLPTYDPETLLNYEIGTKMLFQDRKASVDFALFYSDYSDYLRRGFVVNPNNPALLDVAVGNLGDVSIKGAELSVSAEATDNLTFYFNGAYTDSTLESIDPRASGSGLGMPGDPVDYIPKFSYTLGGEYQFTWRQNVPGFFQVDYNYRDKVSVIDRSITVPTMYSDYIGLLNARIGMAGNQWSVQLFGENLLNENGSFDPWVWWSQAVRNRPRTYGVKVGFDFK